VTDEPGLKPPMVANPIEAPDHRGVPAKVFVTYLIVFFAIWTLRATVLIRVDESIESPLWKNLFSNAVKFTIWVLPVFITLSIRRARPLTYLKLTTPVNKRGVSIAVVVTLALCVIVVAGESILSRRSPVAILGARSSEWLTILLGVLLSPFAEEILFRGFILNRLNESLSFWKANLISAFLFVLAHVPYWVSKNGFSPRVIRDLANVFVLGLLFGWLMKTANSLWPAIGAHIANNFLSGMIHG
jgi:membrane protease YdiL (CAAX protease family)